MQEGEYTYSANVQFDIENDRKLLRFIPNETTVELLREYFIDVTRATPSHHSRILYGSYGTGKSHFLTVLSLLLSKTFTNGVAYSTFITRVKEYDEHLAADIDAYVSDDSRKPLLVVPIVFDFEDFDRCIYFSLKKKLESIGVKINFKTFYYQAHALLSQWKSNDESAERLAAICDKENIDLNNLEMQLNVFDEKSEASFQKIFSRMTFGVKYVYEVSNLAEALNQANAAIADRYSGIVFLFDEFGRYIEDNFKSIKVKSVQDIAEFCDHCKGNNHIILVSHKEIGQYTQKYGKTIANEWKKVEGRYKATPINDKQDQCLSLIKNVLTKKEPAWQKFKERYEPQLNEMYSGAMDFKGFLIKATERTNPFDGGFPLHPIALFALDKLSKKVAQNERTFFTYLASKEDNSLYRFLISHELDEFHFVGIDEIYDYFEPSIKSVQSDSSYEWYKNLQIAIAKNKSNTYDDSPEVKLLKVIAIIGIINDSSVLIANKNTLLNVIDCPKDILVNALESLCEKKILKYSGSYDRYDFFDASIYDVEAMIKEESIRVSDEAIVKTLNSDFVKFVLYPNQYNRDYKISRVFVPIFAILSDLGKKSFGSQFGSYYDGMLVMLLSDGETEGDILEGSRNIARSIILANIDCTALKTAVRKYIAVQYLESQKARYTAQDPSFDKELQYNKSEIVITIDTLINEWRKSFSNSIRVFCNGAERHVISSYEQLSALASEIMYHEYADTLIVNNELINKNLISASIASAKKNAIRSIIRGEEPANYYELQYLSPDYIAVRSVLVKNGFITTNNCETQNALPDGYRPQDALHNALEEIMQKAKKVSVNFGSVYTMLKQPPFGLRDGYISLLFAYMLMPYRKSLIISSHDVEQELTVELFEEIVHRPSDYSFIVADWSKEQLKYLDSLEMIFSDYLDTSTLSKNRLKAIYDAMFSHYKNVPKFSRTTQIYVSDSAKAYRKLMERSHTNYSSFLFSKLKALSGDYYTTIELIRNIKMELENALNKLSGEMTNSVCKLFDLENSSCSLYEILKTNYERSWAAKRQKYFDYYTNAFLDFVEKISEEDSDYDLIVRMSKSLTGFEILYWNDNHKDEFWTRLKEIKAKIDAYEASQDLYERETRLTLITSSGEEKSVVYDKIDLSPLSQTVKNKINATFGNFGLDFTSEDKVQVLLSLLEDLMEGK
ncbi:MAG: hypothetical protein ACM3TR_13880 [Caulobacteraceae bacterium]